MNHSERYDTSKLNAVPIISVVERLGGKVKRQGSTCRTLCPWHSDTNPSLVLYQEKGNRCKCFACGRNGSVIDYVMQVRNLDFMGACEWLGREFGISGFRDLGISGKEKDNSIKIRKFANSGKNNISSKHSIADVLKRDDFNTRSRAALHARQSPAYIRMSYLEQFVSSGNSFCKCLRTMFPSSVVDAVTHLYLLGCYKGIGNDDDVMFPSIDTNLKIHDIKIQHYDSNPDSPTFFHCDKKHIFWLSKTLSNSPCLGGEEEVTTKSVFILPDNQPEALPPYAGRAGEGLEFDHSTLFGAHLLPFNPDSPVVLVESPKNAVVGACALHDYVWVAAGNKNNLSRDSLGCLLHRRVYVIPDHDALDEWRRELSKYEDITHFTFASFCDNELQHLGEKGDIADYVIKSLSR